MSVGAIFGFIGNIGSDIFRSDKFGSRVLVAVASFGFFFLYAIACMVFVSVVIRISLPFISSGGVTFSSINDLDRLPFSSDSQSPSSFSVKSITGTCFSLMTQSTVEN